MRGDLALVPVDERRVDGDEADPAGHGQGGQQARLAEPDHRNVDRAADLQQSGFLEMADDEGVIAGAFGFQRVADRLRRATEFGQRMKVPIRRIEAVHFKAHVRRSGLVEKCLQPLDVRLLLERVHETLVPDFFGMGWFGHRNPPTIS
jgi:hypothetical protein